MVELTDIEVGVDYIELVYPRLFLECGDLEQARGVPSGYITKGLGCKRMAVLDSYQSVITMGADALVRGMRNMDIGPDEIEGIWVATEGGPSRSKPLTTNIIGLAETIYGEGSFRHAAGPEVKAACAAGAWGMDYAENAIRANQNRRKYFVVIRTDDPRYKIGDPAECTQGGGASAVFYSEDPSLIRHHSRVAGKAISDEYGWHFPIDTPYPISDGAYSVAGYLYLMRYAFDQWRKHVIEEEIIIPRKNEMVLDYVDDISKHTPYWKMVRDETVFTIRHGLRNIASRWKKVVEQVSNFLQQTNFLEPIHEWKGKLEEISHDKKLWDQDSMFRRAFQKTKEFTDFFLQKVEPGTVIPSVMGNSYNNSITLNQVSVFEVNRDKNVDLTDHLIGEGYFGSGDVAFVTSGNIQPGYHKIIREWDHLEKIRSVKEGGIRVPLNIENYEKLHLYQVPYWDPILEPENEFAVVSYDDLKNRPQYKFFD